MAQARQSHLRAGQDGLHHLGQPDKQAVCLGRTPAALAITAQALGQHRALGQRKLLARQPLQLRV